MRIHKFIAGVSVNVKSDFGFSASLKTLESMPTLVTEAEGVRPRPPNLNRAVATGLSSGVGNGCCAAADTALQTIITIKNLRRITLVGTNNSTGYGDPLPKRITGRENRASPRDLHRGPAAYTRSVFPEQAGWPRHDLVRQTSPDRRLFLLGLLIGRTDSGVAAGSGELGGLHRKSSARRSSFGVAELYRECLASVLARKGHFYENFGRNSAVSGVRNTQG